MKEKLIENWEFNVLGVYNYRHTGPLKYLFDFVAENHDYIEGDILEAGVFRGRSLLGLGMLLKELGSSKKVYGFDTFEGFPPVYHPNDDLKKFQSLLSEGRISNEHFEKVKKNIRFREVQIGNTVDSKNISTSGDFSGNSYEALLKKIELLGLDNIELIKGPFEETMTGKSRVRGPLMAALFDCDLYSSYMVSLPYVWNNIAKGGYLFLDEYYSLKFPGARIACDEFFANKKDKPRCHQVLPGDFERWHVRRIHE